MIKTKLRLGSLEAFLIANIKFLKQTHYFPPLCFPSWKIYFPLIPVCGHPGPTHLRDVMTWFCRSCVPPAKVSVGWQTRVRILDINRPGIIGTFNDPMCWLNGYISCTLWELEVRSTFQPPSWPNPPSLLKLIACLNQVVFWFIAIWDTLCWKMS